MAALEHDSSFMTRRGAVLVAIVALHLFIFWALATGLAQRAIEQLAPPIQTDIVQEEQKKVEPPPPPPPQFEKPPVEIPPPDVTIDLPVESSTSTAITNVTTKPQPAAPPPPKAAGVRTAAGPGKGFPNSEDYYPPASMRLGEQGVAVVNACVDDRGKLTQDPKIATSSGSSRLDEGALKLAKAASGKYKPATEDGKPVPGCVNIGIRFQLR